MGAVTDQRVDKGVPLGQSDDQDSEVEGSGSAAAALSGGPDFSALGLEAGSPCSLDSGGRRHHSHKQKKNKKGRKSKHSKKHWRSRSSSSSESSSTSSLDAEPDAGLPSSGAWSLPALLDDTKDSEFAARVEAAWARAARGLLPGKGDEPSGPTQLPCPALDWSRAQ